MDLRMYYQKIREKRASIADPFPVMVSNETAGRGQGRDHDGGHCRNWPPK